MTLFNHKWALWAWSSEARREEGVREIWRVEVLNLLGFIYSDFYLNSRAGVSIWTLLRHVWVFYNLSANQTLFKYFRALCM